MITRFQDKTKDKLFYVPTAGGPEGKIPMSATNTGGDNRIKTFKEYSGEYRKGSKKFGKIMSRIMEWRQIKMGEKEERTYQKKPGRCQI
jgi:hypothetical protein